MAGETEGTGRDLPLRTPSIPFLGWDPGGPIYNENGPFLLILDCFSAITIVVNVVLGLLRHLGTLFLGSTTNRHLPPIGRILTQPVSPWDPGIRSSSTWTSVLHYHQRTATSSGETLRPSTWRSYRSALPACGPMGPPPMAR